MSTRLTDRPPPGPEPDDRKTTQQSILAAVGASGAVIAGCIVVFVFLIGIVSNDVWPSSGDDRAGESEYVRVVELPEAAPGSAAPVTGVPIADAVAAAASALPTVASVPDKEASKKQKGGDQPSGDGGEQPPAPVAVVPDAPAAPAPSGDDGTSTAGGGDEGSESGGDPDEQNGRPQQPAPRPVAPAPSPAPSGAATGTPTGSGSDSGGAGGSGSAGNGNHGGRG